MPEDPRRLADLELGLDERHLDEVRFGRSRFLRHAGLALFGIATGLVAVPQGADAAPTPEGCSNAPGCGRCRGAKCISPGCRKVNTCGGAHCWTFTSGCRQYKCCDWRRRGNVCICRGYVGNVC
jgi:hypothetical protein